jgi:hypothetical protein
MRKFNWARNNTIAFGNPYWCSISTVFSTAIISSKFARCRCWSEHWKTIVSYSTWRTQDSHPKKSSSRSKGQACKCASKQYKSSRRRWEHKHNAEYVISLFRSCAAGFVSAAHALDTVVDAHVCSVGLYTDESPGLKVDPVVVLVLSIVFIFSVVALHGMRQIAPTAFRALN